MCGILGLFAVRKELLDAVKLSSDLMSHRGPDGHGTLRIDNAYLFHRRLAIIDPTARADQPMRSKNLHLVFNGEIYNYKDVRKTLSKQGVTFTTTSDTETILKGFEKLGPKIFPHLRGMFSLIIYDDAKKRIYIARDFFGEKPLSVYFDRDVFIAASEPMAIVRVLQQLGKKITLSSDFLAFFTLKNIYGLNRSATPFRGIWKPTPGMLYTYEISDKIKEIQRWVFNKVVIAEEQCNMNFVRKKIAEGVIRSCESDVPLGVLLSGGIDSSTVAYLSKMSDKPITTGLFLYTGKNDTELDTAQRICDDLEFNFKLVKLDVDKIKGALKRVNSTTGEVITNMSFLLVSELAEEAKRNKLKVLLSGSGGDEIFFGYPEVNRFYLVAENVPYDMFLDHPVRYFRNYGVDGYFRYYTDQLAKSGRSITEETHRMLDAEFNMSDFFKVKGKPNLLKIQSLLALTSVNSHSVVMAGDIGGMISSVEIRSPFLYFDIASMISKVNTNSLADLFQSKKILRGMLKKSSISYVLDVPKTGFGHGLSILEFIDDAKVEAGLAAVKDIAGRIKLDLKKPTVRFLLAQMANISNEISD